MRGNFHQLISGEKPVLVDFYADWCGPCKALEPILEQVGSEINGKGRIIRIDVDKNRQLADKFRIQGVPTLMLFKKGKQVWRQSGVIGKQLLVDLIIKNG